MLAREELAQGHAGVKKLPQPGLWLLYKFSQECLHVALL
jgi:hypothetical protein